MGGRGEGHKRGTCRVPGHWFPLRMSFAVWWKYLGTFFRIIGCGWVPCVSSLSRISPPSTVVAIHSFAARTVVARGSRISAHGERVRMGSTRICRRGCLDVGCGVRRRRRARPTRRRFTRRRVSLRGYEPRLCRGIGIAGVRTGVQESSGIQTSPGEYRKASRPARLHARIFNEKEVTTSTQARTERKTFDELAPLVSGSRVDSVRAGGEPM